MKALIVDDEKSSREVIFELISSECLQVNEVAEAKSVMTAIQKIKMFVPDIIFLDVQLGKQTCFDILNEFGEINAHIIFVTAYNQYATKAFDYAAVHYILKPIDVKQLKEAVERCSRLNYENDKLNLVKSFYLKTTKQDYVIEFENISYIKADGSYSMIYYKDGRDIYTSKRIGYYESILSSNFLRIHNSIIVNKDEIKEVNKLKNIVVLVTGESLSISRRRRFLLKDIW